MFILGFFWKKTTPNAALFAMIGGFLMSIIFKFMPEFVDLSFLHSAGFSVPNSVGIYEIPFVDRMGFVFAICVIGMYFISIYETNKGIQTQGLEVDASMFKTSTGFMIGSIIIIGILAALYTVFW
ncbi:MAG TPA: sodium transporter, partial [Chitinophagales bacterium]|nr:sodium transporter [Chitinophagales bacterium]